MFDPGISCFFFEPWIRCFVRAREQLFFFEPWSSCFVRTEEQLFCSSQGSDILFEPRSICFVRRGEQQFYLLLIMKTTPDFLDCTIMPSWFFRTAFCFLFTLSVCKITTSSFNNADCIMRTPRCVSLSNCLILLLCNLLSEPCRGTCLPNYFLLCP